MVLLGNVPCAADYCKPIKFPEFTFCGLQDTELSLSDLEAYLKELAHNISAHSSLDLKAVDVVLSYLNIKFGETVPQVNFQQVYQKYVMKWVGKCFGAKKRREKKRDSKRGIVQMTLADLHHMVAALERFSPLPSFHS